MLKCLKTRSPIHKSIKHRCSKLNYVLTKRMFKTRLLKQFHLWNAWFGIYEINQISLEFCKWRNLRISSEFRINMKEQQIDDKFNQSLLNSVKCWANIVKLFCLHRWKIKVFTIISSISDKFTRLIKKNFLLCQSWHTPLKKT